MGSYLSVSNNDNQMLNDDIQVVTDTCQYLDSMVKYLEEVKEAIKNRDVDIDSSITYLKRNDVRDQFKNIVENNRIISFETKTYEILKMIYIEIECSDKDGDVYKLNFWPCTEYACVGIEKIKY